MSNTQLNISGLNSAQTARDVRRFAVQKIRTTAAPNARVCDSTHCYQIPHPVQSLILSPENARISNKKTTYGWSIDGEIADGVLGNSDLTTAMWKALRTQFCTVHQ